MEEFRHMIKKTQPEEFDLVILGGGTGSTIARWTFAGEGKRVAVVDRKYIGGSCPNIACLPSKNIIHSAKVASYFRRSKEFGITHDGFAIDMADVRERKRRMVRGLNDMNMENYRNTGAEFQIAMIAGLPYTALRDAVLTHPMLVEGLIPLFSSAASAHNVVGTRGARIAA
jgi:hypothetical protein